MRVEAGGVAAGHQAAAVRAEAAGMAVAAAMGAGAMAAGIIANPGALTAAEAGSTAEASIPWMSSSLQV